MKKEKPPWDPKTHRLTLGTVGLVTPEEVQHATEVFRQLTEEIEALRKRNPHPTYAQMRAVMEKYPPEAKAIILLKTLETMGTWLKPWCEWETHLVLLVDQEDEKAIRETIANAYETALFPIRIIGRKLVSQVRARAEAGWPEWDMAKPQVVEEKSNDWGIDSFLASVLEAGDYDEEDKS